MSEGRQTARGTRGRHPAGAKPLRPKRLERMGSRSLTWRDGGRSFSRGRETRSGLSRRTKSRSRGTDQRKLQLRSDGGQKTECKVPSSGCFKLTTYLFYDAPIEAAHGFRRRRVCNSTSASLLAASLLLPLQPFKAPSILLIVLLPVSEPSS